MDCPCTVAIALRHQPSPPDGEIVEDVGDPIQRNADFQAHYWFKENNDLDSGFVLAKFLVDHLWPADRGFDAELAPKAIEDNLQLCFPDSAEDDDRCGGIGAHAEHRIVDAQNPQAAIKALPIGLGLRCD